MGTILIKTDNFKKAVVTVLCIAFHIVIALPTFETAIAVAFYAPKGKKRAKTITITKVRNAFKKTDTKIEAKKIKSDNCRQ